MLISGTICARQNREVSHSVCIWRGSGLRQGCGPFCSSRISGLKCWLNILWAIVGESDLSQNDPHPCRDPLPRHILKAKTVKGRLRLYRLKYSDWWIVTRPAWWINQIVVKWITWSIQHGVRLVRQRKIFGLNKRTYMRLGMNFRLTICGDASFVHLFGIQGCNPESWKFSKFLAPRLALNIPTEYCGLPTAQL